MNTSEKAEPGRSNNVRIKSVCLFLLLFIVSNTTNSQVFRFINYNIDQGIPQNYIYTINQDSSGYLWIGTGQGLARYDGYDFSSYSTADSLSSDFITASGFTADKLWFGHSNGTITHYDGSVFQSVFIDSLFNSKITKIDISDKGYIWVSSQSNGLCRINNKLEIELVDPIADHLTIFDFELLPSNDLLIGSIDGLYVATVDMSTRSIVGMEPVNDFPVSQVQDIIKSRYGNTYLVLTEDNEIFSVRPTEGQFHVQRTFQDRNFDFEGGQSIYEDSKYNLWISTYLNGIIKVTGSETGGYSGIVNYTESNGLAGNYVETVFEDNEGNIWISVLGKGLSKLVDESFSSYSFDENLYGNSVHSIFVDEDYRWYGTEKGLIRISRLGNNLSYYGPQEGLPSDPATALSSVNDGILWIGTKNNGLYKLDIDKEIISRVPISEGINENRISTLESVDNYVWVGTQKGACRLDTENNEKYWYTIQENGLPHNTINHIKADPFNRIWLTTNSNILSFIEAENIEKTRIPNDFGLIDITCIYHSQDGNIWIGTDGNGVFRIEGDSVMNFTSRNGLLSDFIKSIVTDNKGHVWTTHTGGLSEIRIDNNYIRPISEELGISRNTEFFRNAVFKDNNGIIWFGSDDGVLAYDPSLENILEKAPVLNFTNIRIGNQEYESEKKIILPAGRYRVEIEFMGISLRNPELVRYQFKMEGYDEDWSELTSTSSRIFPRLSEGDYTFHVRALGGNNNFSEPVTASIRIKKPFYKQFWFYIICFIIITALIAGYIKRREYYLLKEKEILQEKVEERTAEVVEQKEEIEKQKDSILEQNKLIRLKNRNITDSIKYASNIQTAVFPPPSKVKQLFPESFILNKPKDILSGDFFWIHESNGNVLVTVADCTGHGVPGALMSMLGITFLNEIVINRRELNPGKILYILREEVVNALGHTDQEEGMHDGMDMTLCRYDRKKSELSFSSAINPLILIRKNEVQSFKGNRFPVGDSPHMEKPFEETKLVIKKGDRIYMFSDGYRDQFGGERGKKFLMSNFSALLLEIHLKPFDQQKEILDSNIIKWMRDYEQIDDIMVMGIGF